MGDYRCLFCGKQISNEDVLFVYDKFTEYYQDTKRYIFLMQCSNNNYPLENGNRFKDLYFRATEDVVTKRDSNGFPTVAEVKPCNGLAPAELDGHDEEPGQSEYAKPADDGDIYRSLTRACPHCHCHLPMQFGKIKTVVVTLFGGRASGKTAFLIALLQQLNVQLDKNQLGAIEVLPESAAYMKPQIDYFMQNGITMPTPNQRLFPIIFTYNNAIGESERSCFIAVHDIAGEGIPDHDYLANHHGILNASIMMLIIDPNQINNGAYHENKISSLNDFRAQYDGPAAEQHEFFSEKVGLFLSKRLNVYKELSGSITHVIAVLTKLDLPLTLDARLFNSENVLLRHDIGTQHKGAVDTGVLNKIDEELDVYFRYYLGKASIKKMIANQFPSGNVNICLTGVSTYTLKKKATGEVGFVNSYDEASPKHRIIEPFLKVLVLNDMVNVKSSCLEKDVKPIRRRRRFLFGFGGTNAQL
jgi:hypothetical protein